MNNKQFRESSKELPTEPGEYEARFVFGKIPVYYDGLNWYTLSANIINVKEWREL